MSRSRSPRRSRSPPRGDSYRDRSPPRDEGRVYVGNISSRTAERDLERVFDEFGRIDRIDMKNGFAFVQYESARAATDAVKYLDNTDVDGRRIMVQFPKSGRGGDRRIGFSDRSFSSGGRELPLGRPIKRRDRATGFSIVVEKLSDRTSWQDLKDWARPVANPLYSDVWRERDWRAGTVEFGSKEEMLRVIKELDDTKLDGSYVRVMEDEENARVLGRSSGGGRSRSRSPRRRSRSRSPRRRSRSRSPRNERAASRSRSPAPRE